MRRSQTTNYEYDAKLNLMGSTNGLTNAGGNLTSTGELRFVR